MHGPPLGLHGPCTAQMVGRAWEVWRASSQLHSPEDPSALQGLRDHSHPHPCHLPESRVSLNSPAGCRVSIFLPAFCKYLGQLLATHGNSALRDTKQIWDIPLRNRGSPRQQMDYKEKREKGFSSVTEAGCVSVQDARCKSSSKGPAGRLPFPDDPWFQITAGRVKHTRTKPKPFSSPNANLWYTAEIFNNRKVLHMCVPIYVQASPVNSLAVL